VTYVSKCEIKLKLKLFVIISKKTKQDARQNEIIYPIFKSTK
jgi:hypothetical protein